MFIGSGGGGGGYAGEMGGSGGGIIIIYGSSIIIEENGKISSNGETPRDIPKDRKNYLFVSGSGGGSGGTIYIKCNDLSMNSNGLIEVKPGKGSKGYPSYYTSSGGDGGVGGIRIESKEVNHNGGVIDGYCVISDQERKNIYRFGFGCSKMYNFVN